MPQARILKSKVREAKAISQAISEGDIAGTMKGDKKKPFTDSLKEQIKVYLDRIDPLETLAMGALTVVIHDSALAIEGLAVTVASRSNSTVNWLYGPGTGILSWIFDQLGGLGAFGKDGKVSPTPGNLVKDSVFLWAIAFIMAFLIVRYGGQILQSFGGIKGAFTLLAGLV